MAYSSLLRRIAALVLALAVLPACSPDRYVPAVGVGSVANPDRQLIGRVNSRGDEVLGRVGEVSYNPAPVQNSGSQGIDYLNTPNLAAAGPGVMPQAPANGQSLYAAGSDNALPPIDGGYGDNQPQAQTQMQTQGEAALPPIDGGYPQDAAKAQALPPLDGGYDQTGVNGAPPQQLLVIPSDGVNIDAGLGVAGGTQMQTLPQQPGISMVEGVTAQPVVDGIGTENPVTLLPNSYDTPDPDSVTGSLGKKTTKK